MKITQIVLGSAVSLVLSTSAFAADKPTAFKDLDADGSGGVSSAEFAKVAGVKQEFGKLDKDGDGSLSQKEYSVVLGEEDCE